MASNLHIIYLIIKAIICMCILIHLSHDDIYNVCAYVRFDNIIILYIGIVKTLKTVTGADTPAVGTPNNKKTIII